MRRLRCSCSGSYAPSRSHPASREPTSDTRSQMEVHATSFVRMTVDRYPCTDPCNMPSALGQYCPPCLRPGHMSVYRYLHAWRSREPLSRVQDSIQYCAGALLEGDIYTQHSCHVGCSGRVDESDAQTSRSPFFPIRFHNVQVNGQTLSRFGRST